MKDFHRDYPMFSLCGLPCGLCPIHNMKGGCPGCGGGPGNMACGVAKCSLGHGGVEFCSLCAEFPCDRYVNADGYDSFLPHRNRVRDLQRAAEIGIEAYRAELEEKMGILSKLLDGYNDGRRKSFYCTAVNLLELSDLQKVMAELEAECSDALKERAAFAVGRLQALADERGIALKLNRKPKKK